MLAADGSVVIFKNGLVLPLPGILLSYNLLPYAAIDLRLHSMWALAPIVAEVGARGFLLKSNFTPYLYGRSGAVAVLNLCFDECGDQPNFFPLGTLASGVGIEETTDGGFNFDLEGGPVVLFDKDHVTPIGNLSLALGGRW